MADERVSGLGRAGGRILAALIVLLALLARELHAPPRPTSGGGAVLADVETAWRLHRISLAVSSPRLVQIDRALSYPGERDLTQLPVHDELCALAARLGLGLTRGDVGELPSARRLERFLRGLAPLLAALTLLFTYRWLREKDRVAPSQAVAGLGLVAFLPGFLELGVPGRISIEASAAWGIVLAVGLLSAMWRCVDSLDRMTYAMLAGGAVGLGLATSPLFLVVLIAVLAVFTLQLRSSHGEDRQDVARSALLFWITSALLAQLPTLGGPWVPATSGVIADWSTVLQRVFLVGALPLTLGLAAPRRPISRPLAWIVLTAAGLVVVAMLYTSEPVVLLFQAVGRTVGEAAGARALGWTGAAVGLALLLNWGWRARARLGVEERFLVLLGGMGLLGALLEPAAIVLAIPSVALAAAGSAESRGGAALIWGAAAALLLGSVATVRWRPRGDDRLMAVARAAAWLGETSPETGAWGSATAIHAWGVGVEPEQAPLVVWHARRAVAGLGGPWAAGPAGQALAGQLRSATDLEEFLGRSRAAGLRYWILAPGSAARLGCSPDVQHGLEALRCGRQAPLEGVSLLWSSSEDPGEAVSVLGLAQL